MGEKAEWHDRIVMEGRVGLVCIFEECKQEAYTGLTHVEPVYANASSTLKHDASRTGVRYGLGGGEVPWIDRQARVSGKSFRKWMVGWWVVVVGVVVIGL